MPTLRKPGRPRIRVTRHSAVRKGPGARGAGAGKKNPYFKAGNDLRAQLATLGPGPRHRTAPQARAERWARVSVPGALSPSPAPCRAAPRPSRAGRLRARRGGPEKPAGQAPPAPARERARTPSHRVPGTRPRSGRL